MKRKYVFLSWVAFSFAIVAQGLSAAYAEEEDYQFNWLDPDKKIYVLQNRKYLKARRALLTLMGGVGWSNAYRNTRVLDPRMAYYFTESLGIEAFYSVFSNTNNATYDALKHSSATAIPMIRQIAGQSGALFHWVPWYAKINMFNQILYFDWYLAGGAGTVNLELDTNVALTGPPRIQKENAFSLFLGTGHQYHLTDQFLVRLDMMGAYYQAQAFGNTGDKTWFSDYRFTLGVGLKL